jgi:hypothetical protein
VLITPVVFQGIVRQRHVGSRPPTKLRKERVPLPCTIETLETVRKTSKQLANQHIRNRDNSVHILFLYHIIADYKYDRYPAKSPLKYVLKWSVEIHPQCSF